MTGVLVHKTSAPTSHKKLCVVSASEDKHGRKDRFQLVQVRIKDEVMAII